MNDHEWAKFRARNFLSGRKGVTDNYAVCEKIANDFAENPVIRMSRSQIARRSGFTEKEVARATTAMVKNGFLESWLDERTRYWSVKRRKRT